MRSVLLYWNHICVLHKHEKSFLEKLAKELLKEDIDLKVKYFGLGYPEHMSEYMAKEDADLPDIIVSADLEVFEDKRIFSSFEDTLYKVRDWVPLKQSEALNAAERGKKLLPFLSIPLVYFTREPKKCEETALVDWDSLEIGGINNSAGKSIVKTVWDKWGKETAKDFLSRCNVADMPIGAFQQVRLNNAKTALVPSIYALRADSIETFCVIPKEGPLLIPSYICARNSVAEDVARRVVEGLVCKELCDFYAANGDLILYPECTELHSRQESSKYLLPSGKWLEDYSSEEFYELYCSMLTKAKKPCKSIEEKAS